VGHLYRPQEAVKQNGKMIDGDELEKRLPNPARE
jgi:hypothetical protein